MQVVALREAEADNDMVIRLLNPTGRAGSTTLALPPRSIRRKVASSPSEIKALRIRPRTGAIVGTDLPERLLKQ